MGSSYPPGLNMSVNYIFRSLLNDSSPPSPRHLGVVLLDAVFAEMDKGCTDGPGGLGLRGMTCGSSTNASPQVGDDFLNCLVFDFAHLTSKKYFLACLLHVQEEEGVKVAF